MTDPTQFPMDSETVVLRPTDVFVPITASTTPFAGMPVADGSGRLSLVTCLSGMTYGELRPYLTSRTRPEPNATVSFATTPHSLPVMIGQMLSAARVAGWDLAELASILDASEQRHSAAFKAANHPFPFGLRL